MMKNINPQKFIYCDIPEEGW